MTHLRSRGPASSGARQRSATGFAVVMRVFAKPVTLGLLAWCGVAATGRAGELTVSVVDRSGRGVADVVVTVTPTERHAASAAPRPPATAVMDQRNRAFVPRVLVIAVGTSVEFPNNDSVSHQVYSFSPAKKFQLPLYKGAHHAPVAFDREGLVVLGCNIHDEMAGYIYVTDAPYFGTTGTGGALQLTDLPAGDYRIALWSPLVADPPASLERTIHVAAQEPAASRIPLARDLRARPEPRPRRGDWEY
jgi:plastocyanin